MPNDPRISTKNNHKKHIHPNNEKAFFIKIYYPCKIDTYLFYN